MLNYLFKTVISEIHAFVNYHRTRGASQEL